MGLIFKNFGITNLSITQPNLAGMVITNRDIYISFDGGITWEPTGVTPASSYGGNSSGNRFLHCAGSAQFRSYKTTGSFVGTTTMPSNLMRIYRNGTTGTLIARNYGNRLYRSTDDGLTWTSVFSLTPNSPIFSSGLHYGNGVWFHSYVDTTPTPRLQYHYRSTDDGSTWSSVGITGLPADSQGDFGGFTRYMNGQHWAYLPSTVAQGAGASRVYTSADALTWTLVGTLSGTVSAIGDNYGDRSGVFYRSGFYYAFSNSGAGGVVRSSNGYTFTAYGATVSSGASSFGAVGYIPGSGLWILSNSISVNYYAQIWTTPDPTNTAWTLRFTSTTANSYPFSAFGYNQSDWQAT